jgi:acyltransferase-like protein
MSITEYEVATFVNSFLLFFFLSVVPLLSMISGWLFFSFFDSADTEPVAALSSRIRKRFMTLYLPLVIWNFFYLSVLLIVFACTPHYPILAALNIDFATAGPKQFFNAIFALDHHPLAFQFWFVRDLFVTILLSPILWVFLKRIPLTAAVGLGVVWVVNYDLEIFFRPDVLFFFYLGGLIRSKRVDVGISQQVTILFVVAYLLFVVARAMAPYVIDEPTPVLGAMTRAMRLVGVVACWGLFLRLADSNWGGKIARWGPFAFFLYATHFPLMAEIKLLLWNLMPEVNDFWMVAHYLLSVLLTILICLGAGTLLARHVPHAFSLLNGGRLPGARHPSGTPTTGMV